MIARSECGRVHGPNWMKWLAPFVGKPCTGIEIGTWKGESAEFFLENILTHEKSLLICIDPFTGSVEHHIRKIDCSSLKAEAMGRLDRFGDKVMFRVETSVAVLRCFNTTINWVYIDGAHDSMNVLRDAVLTFDLLTEGGVMIFDDYYWQDMPELLDRPMMGINSFLNIYAPYIEVLQIGSQVAVKKLKPAI